MPALLAAFANGLTLCSRRQGRLQFCNGSFGGWLRAYLTKPEAELLDFIAWAVYSEPLSDILPEQADLAREFLGALRRTAGPYHHLAILRQGTILLHAPCVESDTFDGTNVVVDMQHTITCFWGCCVCLKRDAMSLAIYECNQLAGRNLRG